MDNKVIIIISIVVVVLLLAIVGAVAAVLLLGGDKAPVVVDPNQRPEVVITVPLTTSLMVNVTDEDGKPHVARVHPAFELDASKDAYKELNETTLPLMEIRIRTEILNVVSKYPYEMLLEQGAPTRVAIDIKDAINTLLDTDIIFQVIWQDFIVQ
ncbi:MAG: hypothetical protein ATN31_04440 [Candidatus Epulonipiscioides saccharophilum]|nr:MAG: hypothetical protein ATN31_04440 [Epulopiscium sp. AS2M-Bin001]